MARDQLVHGRITTLAGGVGAAKFIRGLAQHLGQEKLDIIVNTADDEYFYGLYVSPDLDTITYTLSNVANPKTGWGIKGDSFITLKALSRFYGTPWFKLGDRDLATHIFRTDQLRKGRKLSEITSQIANLFGVRARILPMTDDPVRTFVKVQNKPIMPFQEYLVKNRARGVVEQIEVRGADTAKPTEQVINALEQARAIIIAPSNPLVSIGPILALRGVKDVLAKKRQNVAAISPIVGKRPIKGPLHKMMRGLGIEISPVGVAEVYRDLISIFVLDKNDSHYAARISALGLKPVVTDTIMKTLRHSEMLAKTVLSALGIQRQAIQTPAQCNH